MSAPSRSALVTGGTSGIGRAIAFALADQGYNAVATGLTDQEVTLCQQDWRSRSTAECQTTFAARMLNVTDAGAIHGLISSLGSLDVLVNCAGIIRRGGAEHEPDVFSEVIDVNLVGTMRMCVAALPLLKKTRGCVLNIASMLSFFGSGPAPAYSASKGGIAQLTKSLAIAWAAYGIRVNALAPGWIETPLTRPLTEDPGRRQAIIERTPLGRWGRPEDVAGAALFLCSPAAEFITGVVLPVDGGYSIA